MKVWILSSIVYILNEYGSTSHPKRINFPEIRELLQFRTLEHRHSRRASHRHYRNDHHIKKRDANEIYEKIKATLIGGGNY